MDMEMKKAGSGKELALLQDKKPEEVAQKTTQNAMKFYGLTQN